MHDMYEIIEKKLKSYRWIFNQLCKGELDESQSDKLYAYNKIIDEVEDAIDSLDDDMKITYCDLIREGYTITEIADFFYISRQKAHELKKEIFDELSQHISDSYLEFIDEKHREIPKKVKEKVRERDNNRCVNCGDDKNLHFHHIHPYSRGGKHQADNIQLLCASCHAETHKNDRSYYLLKKMAERGESV